MDETPAIPREWLQQEYLRRKERNPAYSLRAFSRHLGLSSGRLSEILTNQRTLTPALGTKIAQKLALSPEHEERFLASIVDERTRRKHRKAAGETSAPRMTVEYRQLSLDSFYVVSDWYHFAILNLMELRGFKNDPSWIARRLGVSTTEVRGALKRLERLELIEKKGARFVKSSGNLTTTHDVSSAALKRAHRKMLELAIDSLENVPVEERDITGISMGIDTRKLPAAKTMIRDFRRKLCAFLEDGRKDEVYSLSVQLFPLSKKSKGGEGR